MCFEKIKTHRLLIDFIKLNVVSLKKKKKMSNYFYIKWK